MIKAETPREEVLIEELCSSRKERNEYKEKYFNLNKEYKEDFQLRVIGSLDANIVIKKGSSTVSLDRDQVQELFRYAHKNNFI